jgi:hypothetical protein
MRTRHHVDAGHAFWERTAGQPGRPHDGHAIGEDQIGGAACSPKFRIAAHHADGGGVRRDERAWPPAPLQGPIDRRRHRQGIEGTPEQFMAVRR